MRSFPWDSLVTAMGDDGFPIYDRSYMASDWHEIYKTFFSNGVFMDTDEALQVTEGEGMTVIVSPGKTHINGVIGWESDERELIFTAPSSEPRIDTVVLRWDINVDARMIDLYVKKGVSGSTPKRPELTRTESVWELGLADVFIPANSSSISADRISDTRLETERCGIVAPFEKLDTTTFYNQLDAAIQMAIDLSREALNETVAGNFQTRITDLENGKVDRSGDTMTGNLKMEDSSIVIKDDNIDITNIYETDKWTKNYTISDVNGKTIATFSSVRDSSGNNWVSLLSHIYNANGARIDNGLDLGINDNGTPIYRASNPEKFCTDMTYRGDVTTNTNWNTLKSGIYAVKSGTAFTGTGAPPSMYTYGRLIVSKCAPGDADSNTQIYISHRGEVATRQAWSGNENYSDWGKIYSSRQLVGTSGLIHAMFDTPITPACVPCFSPGWADGGYTSPFGIVSTAGVGDSMTKQCTTITTLAKGTGTTIPYNTVLTQYGSSFESVTNGIKINNNGIYLVFATAWIVNCGDQNSIEFHIKGYPGTEPSPALNRVSYNEIQVRIVSTFAGTAGNVITAQVTNWSQAGSQVRNNAMTELSLVRLR